jgi:hypothetical protein
MKKSVSIFILTLLCGIAQGQENNWAVGVKLGEPTGITIRKYFNNIQAVDVTVGTYGGILSGERAYRGDNGRYKNTGVSLQIHYLWHTPVFNSEVLRVYYGIGGQINNRRSYPKRLNGQYEKALTLGGSAIGGFEYFIPDNRISVFLEAGTYIEVLRKPFFLSPNLSAGIRFSPF